MHKDDSATKVCFVNSIYAQGKQKVHYVNPTFAVFHEPNFYNFTN